VPEVTTEQFRVAWHSRNGLTGHGSWSDNRALIEAWVERGNLEHSDIQHWLESDKDAPQQFVTMSLPGAIGESWVHATLKTTPRLIVVDDLDYDIDITPERLQITGWDMASGPSETVVSTWKDGELVGIERKKGGE
jgi:hypothetical protein